MRVYPITMSYEPKPDANHADDADDDRSEVMDFYDADGDMDDEGFTTTSTAVNNDISNKCGAISRETVCEETEGATK